MNAVPGMKRFNSPVMIAAAAMVVLPFALLAGGLTLTSATDVVIFAVACMALNILVGDFIYSRYRLVMLAIAAAAVGALWWLLQRTPFGRVVRAGVQNPDMVAALGISLQPYMSAVVAISVALAALAGVLLAPITGVHPAMGAEILTAAFVVVVIGGLGSFWGVVCAALIVGVVRGLTVYFLPSAAEASMYLLMVLVLLIRPRGLFGERILRFE